MKLTCVTLTGADDSVNYSDLLKLSEEFPLVEWAILVSKSSMGTPRFPSEKWLRSFDDFQSANPHIKSSLHLCGQWLRRLLKGDDTIFSEMPFDLHLGCFERIQLNFHGGPVDVDTPKFHEILDRFAGRQFIFQIDGNLGQELLDDYYAHEGKASAVPLFDISHGAGTSPEQWPKPIYVEVVPGEHGQGVEYPALHGYAGGIGPSNVIHELERIQEVVGPHGSVWIDMETKLRTPSGRNFSLIASREPQAPFRCPFVRSEFRRW